MIFRCRARRAYPDRGEGGLDHGEELPADFLTGPAALVFKPGEVGPDDGHRPGQVEVQAVEPAPVLHPPLVAGLAEDQIGDEGVFSRR